MDFGFSSLEAAAQQLQAGLPPWRQELSDPHLEVVLREVASRLHDNYPYHHPLYAGQMLKPPHPVARLAYALAQIVNPNNHALDGGRASSAMEKEAVAELARMFGWGEFLGHLTSGGTMANLEALWVAGRIHPGKVIVASEQAHYTHQRICGVLQLPFESLAADARGRLDLQAVAERLERGDVGTLVVTLGTTALGALDPLPQLLPLARRHGVRVHVDGAYGGYYRLLDLPEFADIAEVDSIVIDPHKHGLQPYGCGCVLFRDPAVGAFYQHDSPYTYFTSQELHLGEISLECSRAGASAVALWATQRLLPLTADGEFANRLRASREAAQELHRRLADSPHWNAWLHPQLDIVVWAPAGQRTSLVSERSQQVFERAAEAGLHLALTQISPAQGPSELEWDQPKLTCLRSCLMKPEHREWIPQIWQILESTRCDW